MIPGQVPDDQIVPALTKKIDDTKVEQPLQLSALTWILGASTLVAAGTGITFGVISRSQEKALRDGYDMEKDLYQGTRAQALDQNRNALIANVAFGVAGAALVGTVISGIVDGKRSSAVQVAPAVSANGAGVTVGGNF